MRRFVGPAFAFALALLVSAASPASAGDDVPQWPHEQQALLRQVDDDLLLMQRKLFKARQQQDAAAIQELSTQFRALQHQRGLLLDSTGEQLDSE